MDVQFCNWSSCYKQYTKLLYLAIFNTLSYQNSNLACVLWVWMLEFDSWLHNCALPFFASCHVYSLLAQCVHMLNSWKTVELKENTVLKHLPESVMTEYSMSLNTFPMTVNYIHGKDSASWQSPLDSASTGSPESRSGLPQEKQLHLQSGNIIYVIN